MKAVAAVALVVAAVAVPFIAPAIATAIGIGGAVGVAVVTAGLEVGLSLLSTQVLSAPTLGGVPTGNALSTSPQQRLYATLDVNAPRKAVFGETAMPTDVRYQAYTGDDQEFYRQIIACSSHQVGDINEIWIDNELAALQVSGSFVAQGRFVGYLVCNFRRAGVTGAGMTVDSTWDANSSLTGCAQVSMQLKLTGPDSTTPSPFQGGVSNRITIRGKGAYLYDPRLDTTVSGGSGGMRAGTQDTWLTYGSPWDADRNRNPALQLLWFLLGWKINGVPALGMGIPPARLDLASFITAANICDESVSLKGGGSEPRYRSDGVISEGDDRKAVVDALCATMNATLRDSGGRISVQVLRDDLASPVIDLGADDIIGDEEWVQTPSLSAYFNVVRGRCVDASDNALYQMSVYPEQSVASPDGIQRIRTIDFPLVESATQAQRLAKMQLMRAQFQGRYSATFGARAWAASVGRIVRVTHPGLDWTTKLFRVVEQRIGRDGRVRMTLLEEDSSIYAWTPASDEKDGIVAGTPTVVDPSKNPLLPGPTAVTTLIQQSDITGLTFSINTLGDITVSSHQRIYSDKAVSVIGGVVPGAPGASAGDVEIVYYDDPTRSGGAVFFQVLRLPGGTGDDSAAYASVTNPYRHTVCAGPVPASGTTNGGSNVGAGGGTWSQRCPAEDEPVLMANAGLDGPGPEVAAKDVPVGGFVWTQHELTGDWGAFRVSDRRICDAQPLFRLTRDGASLRASATHKVKVADDWMTFAELGAVEDGFGRVVLLTVEEAHTYVCGGLLSHNKVADTVP